MSILIGVAGASASGKSVFANYIAQQLNNSNSSSKAIVIVEDSYYRPLSHLTVEQRAQLNFDHPDAIDGQLLTAQLSELKQGKSIEQPIYCYKTHNRIDSTIVKPAPVIIVEGLHILGRENLLPLLDLTLFIDTPMDICLMRRTLRDVQERDRTYESVFEQYEKYVRPMFIDHVLPSKKHAQLVVDGTQDTKEMWNTLVSDATFKSLRLD